MAHYSGWAYEWAAGYPMCIGINRDTHEVDRWDNYVSLSELTKRANALPIKEIPFSEWKIKFRESYISHKLEEAISCIQKANSCLMCGLDGMASDVLCEFEIPFI